MWKARTKQDLVIEVWEKLDCEDVGRAEIEAIEVAVAARFGDAAVDSPMVIARLLADEGAELRHAEILELYVERALTRPYDAALRNILRLDGLRGTLQSIRDLERLRRKYLADNDRPGLRKLREAAIRGKRHAAERASATIRGGVEPQVCAEIAHWLTVWLQTPESFDEWVELRQRSRDFIDRFGKVRGD
jgi:hypothetical protein